MSGSNDLLGDLVAKAQQGARGETGALELLERETEMRNLSKKAKTIIAGAAIAGLASAGGAYAYWTTTGSGNGSATAGTNAAAVALVITQVSPPTGMFPGGAAQNIDVTVANNATYSQSVTSISATPSYPAGCLAANWTITPVANSGATLAAATVSSSFTVATIALNDLGTGVNQNGCKLAVVTFAFAG